MDDIVKEFLIESRENLDRLDQELVNLESDPNSKELLSSIFRTMHTIKGSCGFLGFPHLEKVAHAGENLLAKLRDGALSLNAEITSALLATVDAVRRMLSEIQATEGDGENDYPELLERLKKLNAGNPASASPVIETAAMGAASPANASSVEVAKVETLPESGTRTSDLPGGSITGQTRPSPSKIGSLLVERGCVKPEDLSFAIRKQEEGDRRRLGDILVALGACSQADVDGAQQLLEARGRSASLETVRVGVDLLDSLMNLVGELVLARNQLLQLGHSSEDARLLAVSQNLNLIVTEVQEQVIRTRIQPISNVWNKFPRSVRDLALSCGKEVHLETYGQDTELDRTVIEAVRDPLTHLIRNAIDHGIETPEARRKAGKDPAGHLQLRACQQGGKVIMEVADDGAGLNAERLCNKAIERGMISRHQAKRMSEAEIFNLIFMPGFSTVEKVTNVSGRGVGMDVVKTNVEKIGGAIDIESVAGKGTTVRVKMPLTLAIVPALIVTCRNERFAIPEAGVLELASLDGSGPRIEDIQGHPVFRRRGNLLPVLYLDRELGLGNAIDPPNPRSAKNIVILQADTRQLGLVVDDILDTEEIVVKPLGEQFKRLKVYAGATLMGDGGVALILDVVGLAQRAHIIPEAQTSAPPSHAPEVGAAPCGDRMPFLLARNGPDGQVAIRLPEVARLAGVPASSVRRVGQREVMDYHGEVMPIVRLSQILPHAGANPTSGQSSSVELVVYTEHRHNVGVIVDGLVDIVEDRLDIQPLASRPGVVGSFVMEHDVVEMLDLPAIVRAAIPEVSGELK